MRNIYMSLLPGKIWIHIDRICATVYVAMLLDNNSQSHICQHVLKYMSRTIFTISVLTCRIYAGIHLFMVLSHDNQIFHCIYAHTLVFDCNYGSHICGYVFGYCCPPTTDNYCAHICVEICTVADRQQYQWWIAAYMRRIHMLILLDHKTNNDQQHMCRHVCVDTALPRYQ